MATISLDTNQITQGSELSNTNRMIQNADFDELQLDNELITFVDTDEIEYAGDKSFWDRTVQDFYKRTNQIQDSRVMLSNKEITVPEHMLHVYGKGGAGFAADTAFNVVAETIDETWDGIENVASVAEGGIRMILPEGAENAIDENQQRIANMLTKWWNNSSTAEAGRKAIAGGAKMYAKWKEENPRAAMNLESVVDIGVIFATPGRLIPWKGKQEPTIFQKSSKNQLRLAGLQGQRNKYDKLHHQLYGKNAINENNVSRVTNEGLGRVQTINYNQFELDFMDTLLANGVKNGANPSQNSQAMTVAIENFAKQLKSEIVKTGSGTKAPIPWTEVKSTLTTKIDELIKTNPVFSEAGQQTVIKQNLERIFKIIDEGKHKGTALGVFELRQAYDQFVRTTAKAGALDGSINKTAMDESVRVIRTALNDIVAQKLPNTKVKELLSTQSTLYKARELILPAVQADAKHAVQRVWKNLSNAIGLKMDYNRMMAVAFGGSAYGAAEMTGASLMAAVGVGGTAFMASVALQTRATKIALGKTLALMDKAIALPGANPNVVKALSADRAVVAELFKRPIEKAQEE
jgi:hypothetical protein